METFNNAACVCSIGPFGRPSSSRGSTGIYSRFTAIQQLKFSLNPDTTHTTYSAALLTYHQEPVDGLHSLLLASWCFPFSPGPAATCNTHQSIMAMYMMRARKWRCFGRRGGPTGAVPLTFWGCFQCNVHYFIGAICFRRSMFFNTSSYLDLCQQISSHTHMYLFQRQRKYVQNDNYYALSTSYNLSLIL